MVVALGEEGVVARARPDEGPDFTGVWAGERKIASIGVHVARGVTTHGFAVNVENDLQPFSYVVPCGLDGVQMTSLIRETRRLSGSCPASAGASRGGSPRRLAAGSDWSVWRVSKRAIAPRSYRIT